LTLQLLLQAIKEGRQCFFFSLDYTQKSLSARLAELDKKFAPNQPLLKLDLSNEISSDYIINQTNDAMIEGSLVAVDYLQLLDQNRSKPSLQKQVEDLKAYAKEKKCVVIFISQIDRFFDEDDRTIPNVMDVRLPNPLDIGLFNKSVFVQNSKIYA
jgi:replicative DNA helicase